ncbi:MAG: hypothetical protein IPO30_07980 [Hyphomonadaceae bacterium]|nr:hypothetical protein [Hyphomonadaceae bacterium]
MADITRPTSAHDFTRLNPLAFATDLVLAGKDETISELPTTTTSTLGDRGFLEEGLR